MKKTLLMVSAVLLPLLASAQTAKPAPAPVAAAPQVAAHAELITGSVTVGTGDAAHSLGSGDPVYEKQTVAVGPNSYANLRFQDGGHVLLRPNSEFAIEAYHYTAPPPAPAAAPGAAPVAAAPADSSSFFRLLKGGFRAISGLIGKVDHAAYKVTTPAATIGIRGTDYEVQICTDDCPTQTTSQAQGTEVASTNLAGLQLAQAGGGGGGVIAATHEGSISLHTSRGDFTVNAGQVALALVNGQIFMLPVVPDLLLQNPAPSPESCK